MAGEVITNNEPPPSYDSLFKELATKKAESGGVVDYTQGVTKVYRSKISGVVGVCLCAVCCSILGIALPIAEIVIGSMYLHQCPAERLLPIYLIVGGVFSILSGGGCGGQKIKDRSNAEEIPEEERKDGAGSCCGALISLFLFIWFICGSVWVFKMKECDVGMLNANTTSVDGCFTTGEIHSMKNFYCKKLLYDFVYYETIVKWSFAALVPVAFLLACCCAVCAYTCGEEEEQDNTGSRTDGA